MPGLGTAIQPADGVPLSCLKCNPKTLLLLEEGPFIARKFSEVCVAFTRIYTSTFLCKAPTKLFGIILSGFQCTATPLGFPLRLSCENIQHLVSQINQIAMLTRTFLLSDPSTRHQRDHGGSLSRMALQTTWWIIKGYHLKCTRAGTWYRTLE